MGRPTTPGIFRGADGWEVDKVVRGDRLRHSGAASYAEAQGWLDAELTRRRERPAGAVPTFEEAATQYVEKHQDKISLELDVYLLELVLPFIGQIQLDKVDDEALEPFRKAMRKPRVDARGKARRPLKAKSINLALDRVRRILTLSARSWRKNGKPWLPGLPPIISMLPESDAREPMQISWPGQRKLLPALAEHLSEMALFKLQTGARDEPLCNLRWRWEVRIPGHDFSVFVVPKRYVKGRKADRVIVCNSVAQSVIERQRWKHPEFVFVYARKVKVGKKPKYRPVASMDNTGWQRGRERAGMSKLRPHDLRHTVGMRLREAGVAESTVSDILWHKRAGMTAHYSVAQVVEIREALEKITSERHANNVSLASIIAQQRLRVPAEVPVERKTA